MRPRPSLPPSRLLLGKNVKILLKCPVKLELKSDKTDNRILVFTSHRLFVMTAKGRKETNRGRGEGELMI